MSFFQRRWLGLPILSFILAGIFGISAIAWAAMTESFNGSMTVVAPPQPTTYSFQAFDAASGGSLVTDAFYSLGNVIVGVSVTKTAYVQNTGTGDVTVTAAVSGLTAGTVTGAGTPVSVPTGGVRVAVPLVFTAGGSPAGVNNFTVTFTSTP